MAVLSGSPAFVSGKEVEWSDQKFYIEGAPVAAIKGVRFGVKTEKAHLFAEGDSPFSIQSGNREPNGSFKILKSALDIINLAAVVAGGRDINDLEFDIVITYKAKGVRGMQVMTLSGCQTSNFEYGWDQNAKEMVIDIPFLYLELQMV